MPSKFSETINRFIRLRHEQYPQYPRGRRLDHPSLYTVKGYKSWLVKVKASERKRKHRIALKH